MLPNLSNKDRYLAVSVLALMLGLMIHSCLSKVPTGPKPVLSEILPANEASRVAIKGNTLVIQTAKGTEYKYVPDEGQAVIDVTHEGVPTVTVKNKGFTHVLGVDLFIADKLRVGVDCELVYWNRWGIHTGIGLSAGAPIVVGIVGLNYKLDQLHLTNTAAWVGYTTNKNIAVGLRIGF